ncbi:alpha/beta fold hydrolase [Streptomyces sp. AC555_RSS877]|uniref:alpha/beta fold hydrolase n=1 Tax=Streptomyces sp. AC555_RSS877 TaxID=2823688 RepID=UPI001C2689C7|nr:alpha/beta hydrolase [Streptomyces sp. AC555_RSS877]
MGDITTSDGVTIHYEEQGSGPPLVLIHGWGFSGRFFTRNVAALAEHARVITVDLRGHGDSGKPRHGYRVSRLAKDLFDLLEALDLREVTVLGWSLGCPVVWSYLELFGSHRLARAVYVQQAPRQYYAPDWKHAHATCYDEPSLAALQTQLTCDPSAFDEDQIGTIFAGAPTSPERELLLAEMAKSPPYARNALMADHTRHDWRDLLPAIRLPGLVLVARQDQVFPWQGPARVGEALPGARTVFFEHSGHALFFDEPEKFHRTVTGFLTDGRNDGRNDTEVLV